jgi:hypothetical protein
LVLRLGGGPRAPVVTTGRPRRFSAAARRTVLPSGLSMGSMGA